MVTRSNPVAVVIPTSPLQSTLPGGVNARQSVNQSRPLSEGTVRSVAVRRRSHGRYKNARNWQSNFKREERTLPSESSCVRGPSGPFEPGDLDEEDVFIPSGPQILDREGTGGPTTGPLELTRAGPRGPAAIRTPQDSVADRHNRKARILDSSREGGHLRGPIRKEATGSEVEVQG